MKFIILSALFYAAGAKPPPKAGGWTRCSMKESEWPGYCQTYDPKGNVIRGSLKQMCSFYAPCRTEVNGCRMNALQTDHDWYADCSKPKGVPPVA
ncbi:hypothetical protein E2P81_ATG11435 [Venturia nashicola]|uniref:Uncharacterized protein n=1 Tax=Venturia nashicola TaxID=86259 RepID=A0A4Z1P181_9PEZI|nr:hypothetical protein E6O75_ATG11127 [Venturia nashicola]TLD35316.1 hypothetical protein E2P81_ATG11435 [Venturia nashicola]